MDANQKKHDKKKVIKTLIILLVVALIIFGMIGINVYYEYLQYAEIGIQYVSVFFTNLYAKLTAQLASLIIVFVFFLVNNFAIRKTTYKYNNDLGIIKHYYIIAIFTLVISWLASNITSDNVYQNFLTFSNATNFDKIDPLFGYDLGYFIFTRPFYIAMVESIKGIMLFNILYTLFIYVILQLRDGIDSFKNLFKNRGVVIHTVVNIMLYVASTALSYKFVGESIVYNNFNGLLGAGFTDVKIWTVYYNIAPLLLIIIVPLVIYFLFKGKFSRAITSILIFPSIWILTFIIATINQSVIVESDELAIENKYIQNHINMTRSAYDLENIEEVNYDFNNNLTYKDIMAYSDILTNVPKDDKSELITTVNKKQGMGTFNSFNDCDFVPYTIDGEKTFVGISARELDNEKLGRTVDSFVNKTFKYTHGTGVVVTDMRTTDDDGKFIVKDIPPISNVGFPKINQPRIYYGEKMNNSVVVNTYYTEVDYENNSQSGYKYDGFGGIQMSILNRGVLSIMQGNYQLLFSGQITNESRTLINRNIIDRVVKVAPFFMYDSDPYMIVTDNGELKWIIDAYTVSSNYPYSAYTGTINYIRCPAKAIIDAYNGTVTFYITDKNDAFIKTYQKMYPTLFSNDDIPADISSHLRYPKDIFKIKAEMYKRYHVTDAIEFYDKNSIWDFAQEKNKKGDAQYIDSYYNLIKDNSNDQPMSVLSIAYTQNQSNTINCWLEVGSEQGNYGKMTAKYINRVDNAYMYGTMYAENQIEANEDISKQLSVLAEGGAQILVGNIRMLPIKNSFIYIAPVYSTNLSNTVAYPQLKKMVVVYNDSVAMEDTLVEGLQVIFGKKPNTIVADTIEEEQTLNDLIDNIIEMYESVKQYNMANDWVNYGRAMRELDDNMAILKEKKKEIDKAQSFVGPPRP